MSSYDKVVKLACKPKAAPPKAKYLDPIIAATWSDDGAVHDVCKALSPRFREPNAIVVFKALIVLHTMIRNGATDNVLSYLSTADVLRLRNVANGQWEGYDTPQNLAHYAFYLDARVRAYADLKHDAVRVQSESNRDMRVSQSLELGRAAGGPKRSNTIAGRKLRSMTVEKGLLRETKAVHRMIDTLVECKFYLDDLEDELTTTALRMLVKDLLVLFQAGNEGVINVLEHYFEMSKVDAQEALNIYRHFCKQTEQVVEYLGVAKKLQNLLNVPIPNLKHAPVSLAGALEEYLKDPNFEQNRLEYRANKAAADGRAPAPLKSALKKDTKLPPSPSLPSTVKGNVPSNSSSSKPGASLASSSSSKQEGNQAMVDFFSSIDEEQQTIFNPQTGSPSAQYFQQQAQTTYNPFVQRQSMAMPPQMTGPFPQQPFVQPQQTGFLQPQQTAFQTSPFPQVQQQQQPFLQPSQQPQQQPPFLQQSQQSSSNPFPQQRQSTFVQAQPTGFLQPQATGSNPFRQSMAFPQSTGTSPFPPGGMFGGQGLSSPFQPPRSAQGTSFTGGPNSVTSQQTSSAFATSPAANGSPFAIPNRPQSTPITSQQRPAQSLTAVATHQTGTKNPFGVPVEPAPPVPKPPTLQELSMGAFGGGGATGNGSAFGTGPMASAGQFMNGQQRPSSPRTNSQPLSGGSTMANVASSFASKPTTSTPTGSGFNSTPTSNPFPGLAQQNTATTSTFSDFSSLSSNVTGSTAATTAPSSISHIQPQQTGFGGIKPFKPSSSFGASLLDSLPPVSGSPANAGSQPQSPGASQSANTGMSGMPSTNAPNFSFKPTGSGLNSQQTGPGALNAQPTGLPSFSAMGSTGPGAGLRPQMTGPNPFRASMVAPSNSTPSFAATPPFQMSTGFQQPNLINNATGALPSFSSASFGGAGRPSPFGAAASNQDGSNQQNGSLI